MGIKANEKRGEVLREDMLDEKENEKKREKLERQWLLKNHINI